MLYDEYVVVVDWTRLSEADRQFAEWLDRKGLTRDDLGDKFIVETGRGLDGHDVRRYRVSPSLIS